MANPLDRFAIGDRDKLKCNSDGSLDIYIQADRRGTEGIELAAFAEVGHDGADNAALFALS